MNRAKTIVDGSFNRYVKHIPYLMSLNDYQLRHIIREEQHIPNRALPHLITIWQQVGGDIDKKLNELGISITDVMGLRLRFLQCENPNHEIMAFIPSMIEYYNMLNYKPENYIDALAQLFGKYNLSRNDIETILSKAVAKHAQAE